MAAAGINPITASDSQLAQYADLYLEYDAQRHVTKESLDGGKYVYTFTYFTPSQISSSSGSPSSGSPSSGSSSSGAGPTSPYNVWSNKTVESRPDGSARTVYTNEIGQVLLEQLTAGTSTWIEVQQFTTAANLSLHAYPSAVAGFDETQPALGISLKPASGLIETYTWFGPASSSSSSQSSSSASGLPPATPDGYLQAAFVQQGANGTPILLRQYKYGSQSAAGNTVYPVTTMIEYRNDDGTGAVTTSYAYAFYSGTNAVQQRTTTYPVVSTAQNGSGIAPTRHEYLDQLGNLRWEMGPRGFIMYQDFDAVTGGVLRRIDDFNTSLGGQPTPPAGWTTPAGGGLNLVTDYQVDGIGRPTQELGPSHTVSLNAVATVIRTATWTVYQDSTLSGAASEVWTAQGYATGTSPNYTYTLVNPVSITRYNDDGQMTDQISAIRGYTDGPLVATDTFQQSSYCRWTTNVYDDFTGQLTVTRVYFLIPASGAGAEGTNYNETDIGYDGMGRQNRVLAPGLTITRTVFDPRSLPLSLWVGTNDNGATDTDPTGGGAPGNNMVAVQINQYDSGASSGDGNLTLQTLPVDGNSANDRLTTFLYDWRNRQVQITAAQDWYQVSTFDTMNRVTQVDRHAQVTGNLIGRNQRLYDDRGQIYQTILYGVDPSTGTVGNSLVSNRWFDPAGNVIMSLPAGSNAFVKSVYDGVGRETTRYVGYYLGTITYDEATSVADDTIMEQVETLYDGASNVIQTTTRQRFHNATGTGPLTEPG
ncbi:MAG: hypothetical protein B7Z73_05335 [Planctomycetia bacterium 21-64-5]|nr:MAG: hypothetical protein B7Z73_05335 [Planctomycetia bacterium 21-64-5]